MECISDDQGVKWRPLILQYKSNGGIPTDQYDCIFKSQTTPCSYGTDPPQDGADYINLNSFASYAIDGKYHMKMMWDFGESLQWKQVEDIFGVNQEQTVTEAVGTNHKGHTDLMFQGLSVTKWGERFTMHLFDGSTNQAQTAAWDESMPSCSNVGGDWRTYAAVIWENNYQYDKSMFYNQSLYMTHSLF